MRALIVAPNISKRMGGEAVLPYHYIEKMSARGVELHAATHARVREEILESPLADKAQFHFLEDARAEQLIHRMGEAAPAALRDAVFNASVGFITMARLGDLVRRLDRETAFYVIHQPIPVSPMFPSFLTGLRAPTIIGPMNGAMAFPPAFRKAYSKGADSAVAFARPLGAAVNRIANGKGKADLLLVANDRTRMGLPGHLDFHKVQTFVENGVDLRLWTPHNETPRHPHFVFVGRLIPLKAVDILIDAFACVPAPAQLTIIGDGPERASLESRSEEKATGRVHFTGFLPQPEIAAQLKQATALVFPSLRDCGGAVILEAFACARPAIATAWGGPLDYITPETGVLIDPCSRNDMVTGFQCAMERLAGDSDLANSMGKAARKRVEDHFDWSVKADQMLDIYNRIATRRRSAK
ncbi:MAG: glycosyltransferase family 4 protein [Pseudomonadota bacterium]